MALRSGARLTGELLGLTFCSGFGIGATLAGAVTPLVSIVTPSLAVIWLGLVSIWTLALFAIDKRAAQAGKRRIPELRLITGISLGGMLGAFLAMSLLRHKSRKQPFGRIAWIIGGINTAMIVLTWVLLSLRPAA